MRRAGTLFTACACVAAVSMAGNVSRAAQTTPAAASNRAVTEADCTAPALVATITPSKIGEPVRGVTLQAAWVAATDTVPAHCRIDGIFAPVDPGPTARPINFRVILPASWNRRAAQLGGGGINGVIPNLTGVEFGAAGPSLLQRGFATYGSDSGHQLPAFGPRRGGPPSAPPDQDWALNDEAIRNFGYMQMKKTRDAAMVLVERMYGERPRFNYFIGDRLTLLFDWVERGVAPGMSITVAAGEKSLPLCSYPSYPKYIDGPAASASSYRCTAGR
jgi:feruloyl esterase